MSQHAPSRSTPAAPVHSQVTVEASRERAFDFFTRHMAAWWSPSHSIGQRPFATIVVEPREGGRWCEVDDAGVECRWGSVLAWQPPERLLLRWQLDGRWSYDPDLLTEVEVRFEAVGPTTTRVVLEHRGLEAYGDDAAEVRDQLDAAGGWRGLLERLAAALRG